ncbi:hypothetical protein TRFO_06473 [Tritrichomonas foetus]|uniref:Uncharacterized protein n=1 Tax=Tritrichomonas foetus TaxID=1144522 RepID=A0A1J4K326_9EUKA|nr:hypothetical protein TRFO_06473 [Tritrichomonas foetus]|eukprot:OHT04148.1 hypothetical protein TRFO_06473 [Tritrichomonas foetus]
MSSSMKKKRNGNRLVPLEILYPNHPPKEQPKNKPKVPFYKPGIAAQIPEKTQEATSVRYLQASLIKKNLLSLEQPLRDIEDDASFIANSMNAALQVPKSIEMTFNRIHGRIYDIQREIEYSSNSQDDRALSIQKNFRMSYNKKHLTVIVNALHNTMRRDCASIHQSLLGFLLSYAKADDHFKMLLNRRFLVRNRNALKYWREWSIQSRELEKKQKSQIAVLHRNWLNRRGAILLQKWKLLTYSKHSRKALKELHARIAAEAQRRLADSQVSINNDSLDANQSIYILLSIEREKVIIDFGHENYANHMKKIVFKYWRLYVEQCRNESRSGNAIAREHYINHMKKSFFQAWYSLSVGRVVVFGGYAVWHRPENRLLTNYRINFSIKLKVLKEWRWLCIRRNRMEEFRRRSQREFMRKCLVEFHFAASARRERLSRMMETYINLLHQRMHRVFSAWHYYTAKEKVRKKPLKFLLSRMQLMRKYRTIRQAFRRWNVRYMAKQTQRFLDDAKSVNSYTRHWAAAGNEMSESMNLISQLNTKLTQELEKRKEDLSKSVATAIFMKNEQKSLAYAMQNVKMEIEKIHKFIGKTSMRYFVDIKPIHSHVVDDVPTALAQYIEQKEAEKARLLAQKQAAAQAQISAPKQTRNTNNANKRRKTTFAQQHTRSKATNASRSSIRSRKSTGPNDQVENSTGGEEEEE